MSRECRDFPNNLDLGFLDKHCRSSKGGYSFPTCTHLLVQPKVVSIVALPCDTTVTRGGILATLVASLRKRLSCNRLRFNDASDAVSGEIAQRINVQGILPECHPLPTWRHSGDRDQSGRNHLLACPPFRSGRLSPRDVRAIHEYSADSHVLNNGQNSTGQKRPDFQGLRSTPSDLPQNGEYAALRVRNTAAEKQQTQTIGE
jgi:hypothetical protein